MSDLVTRDMAVRPPKIRDWLRRLLRFDTRPLSLLVFVALAVLVFGTFRDYGISTDEHVQNVYGHYLLSYYLSSFHDLSAFQYSDLRYYGGAFDLIAALVNLVSPFGEYETRHLLGGIVGLIGFFGAWRLARLLAGERAAFFVLLLLVLTPALYGHNFINPKDAPLAWAMIWATYYACRAISELPRPKLKTALGLGAAFGLAIGTRVVGMMFLSYCLPAFIAYAVGRYAEVRDGKRVAGELANVLIALLPALPVAFLLTAFFWPWVVQAPGNLMTALTLFANYTEKGYPFWNGYIYDSTALPRLYLPVLLVFQLPEAVLVGLLAFTIFSARSLANKGLGHLTDRRSLGYSVLVSAAVIPVLYCVILRPAVYNGFRHFLFVVPPLVVLGGIGIDQLYGWALNHGRRAAYGFAMLVVVFVVRQTAIMVDLHPDEYVYFNALAGGVPGAGRGFELDYWGTSLAEATRGLATFVEHETPKPVPQERWRVFVCGNPYSAAPFFPPGSNLSFAPQKKDADFAVSIKTPFCDVIVKGPRIFQVKRGGAVLSYVTDLRGAAPP